MANDPSHLGLACVGCKKSPIVHSRYKCLRCVRFDLCATCYEANVELGTHVKEHPFQCLLDRNARELYYAGEPIPTLCADSFTCPICGTMGYGEKEFLRHVHLQHSNDLRQVYCPLCVSIPGARPGPIAHLEDHLLHEHIL